MDLNFNEVCAGLNSMSGSKWESKSIKQLVNLWTYRRISTGTLGSWMAGFAPGAGARAGGGVSSGIPEINVGTK